MLHLELRDLARRFSSKSYLQRRSGRPAANRRRLAVESLEDRLLLSSMFFDDFEGDLSQWTGKSGGGHNGQIVADPLRPGNHVVTFGAVTFGGDIFSDEVDIVPDQEYVLSFEYLGLLIPGSGGNPDNLGGTIGFSEDTPGRHRWLTGTTTDGGIESDLLIDDGQWHSYSLQFDPFDASNNTIRAMVQDWNGSGGVAGDAFFDNVTLESAAVKVSIDIKPDTDENTLSLSSAGAIPVAILSTPEFDASSEVIEDSLTFGRFGDEDSLLLIGPSERPACSTEDVNNDGLADLQCQFDTQLAGFAETDIEGILQGQTIDGTIEGRDSVRIVPSDPNVVTLFIDAFEADLSQWVGKNGGAHHGVIVADPLRPGNQVLTFDALNLGGDMFSSQVEVVQGNTYLLSFEYLGLLIPDSGANPDDLGGTIGFSEDTPGGHRWLTGTTTEGGIETDLLVDDGQWRSYSFEFDPFVPGPFYSGNPSNNTIRAMVQDWVGSGGVAGDAFFDNIRLSLLLSRDDDPAAANSLVSDDGDLGAGTAPKGGDVALLTTPSRMGSNSVSPNGLVTAEPDAEVTSRADIVDAAIAALDAALLTDGGFDGDDALLANYPNRVALALDDELLGEFALPLGGDR